MKIRADVAGMLRAGATQREIRAQLHVSSYTVTRTRKALGIPAPKRRGLTGDALRTATEQRHPVVADMLRAGASLRQIAAATGTSYPTITRVRRILGIPIPDRRAQRQRVHTRTIAETLAHYTQRLDDGHAHWTGPFNGTRPTLWHHQRPYQARREAFRVHHGRDSEGRVRVGCDDPACVAGAHLTDQTIRDATPAATTGTDIDSLYDAIFGTTP